MFKLCKRFFNKYLGNSQRYTAFTLAEVLITLGIIGVVAAMTIPTLIHQKNVQTAETKLKKFYSTMSQATQLLQAEYGDYSNWSPSDSDDIKPWFDEYLSKVLKYTKAEYVQNYGTRYLRVYLAD